MAAVPIPNTPHPTPLGEDPVLWLRLIRSRRVGPVTFHRLVADHGSVAAALAALPAIALAAGIENYQICPEAVALAEWREGRRLGAVLLRHGAADYPPALGDLGDAPPVLWALGDRGLLLRSAIAVVGARNASSLGLRMARRLGESLGAAGHVVVSGLARGIDAEAHHAALATGTVAVLAGGVDVAYPEENAALAAAIRARGCLISEQPIGTQPLARHFPARNRIVSGLARAVVVVEAAAGSGSLITARTALDQGREVLAVPGHPFDARAAGCNQLLRDGAALVRGAGDVIELLGEGDAGRAGPAQIQPENASPEYVPPEYADAERIRAERGRAERGRDAQQRDAQRQAEQGQADQGQAERGRGRAEYKQRLPARTAPAPVVAKTADTDHQPGGARPLSRSDPQTAEQRIAARMGAPALTRSPCLPPGAAGDGVGTSAGKGRWSNRQGAAGGLPGPVPAARSPAEIRDLHQRILGQLGPSPLAEDQLIRDLGLSAALVSPALVTLEIEGRIERQPGGLLSRLS